MSAVQFNIFSRMLYNFKTILKVIIGHNYQLYKFVAGDNDKKKELLISHSTDVVIEGFPRVGNTYFVLAFEELSQDKLNIAHHVHLTCQIKKALSQHKPIIVLVRNPIDAVISLKIREPKISMHVALAWYCFFYKFVLKNKSLIIVKTFSSFINDSSKIIINDFHFKNEVSLKDNEIFNRINQINKNENNITANNRLAVSMPTEEKEERKRALRKKLNSNTWLAKKCSKVYQELQELVE